MRRSIPCAALLLLATLALPARSQDDPHQDALDFFEKRIRPVLVDRCYSCHSATAEKVKGNYLLDTRDGILKGGDLGPSVVPGDPGKSFLLKAIQWADDDLKMPPKKRLSPDIVKDFELWIKSGAADPRAGAITVTTKKPPPNFAEARRRWPFAPVSEPALPAATSDWARNPIDRFLLARLTEKGLKPAADADKRTLLRRVTFDLTGLPPTPEELDAFLADTAADAFTKVVDRLLASPAYGERWGRHWLDVVRYADTAGDNSDFPVPQVFKYRNYVIDAFNQDKPYDQFIREQLAGDLLPHKSDEERRTNLIATGYLANAKRFGSRVDDYPWHLTIEDTIDNLGRTYLGLTINCTRCHDHKFDPITNEDYYALYGIFASTRYPWPGIELKQYQENFIPLAPADVVEKVAQERAAKKAELDLRAKELEAEKKHYEHAAELALDGEADRIRELIPDFIRRIDAIKKGSSLKEPLPYETAYAVCEAPQCGNAKVQIKGDPERLGREVPRRFIEVLGGQSLSSESKGSGRYALAEWIADAENPLTARVMANRLWQYHFGKGIVQTPSDFGRQGKPPTHPELLDWLARRFVESGWSVKSMHRLLLSSHAYRMSCDDNEAAALTDPNNDLLHKFRRRRLEAEAIRDALLAVSGDLDRGMGGPHPFPPSTAWDYTQHKPFIAVYDNHQRSVYLMTQRIRRHPFFGTFDGAETNMSTALRITSTTPLQALFMLNDPLVHEQAKAFAARLQKERKDDADRVQRGFALALGRAATPGEAAAAEGYIAQTRTGLGDAEAWESFARILFRLNEFVYVR